MNKAFSFTEVIITVSLFLLMASIGFGVYFRYYTLSLVNEEIYSIIEYTKEARFKAQKNPYKADYGVRLDTENSKVIIFRPPFDPDGEDNKELEYAQIEILDLDLQPDPGITDEIIFERQTGKTENHGAFTVGKGEYQYTITINAQGVID